MDVDDKNESYPSVDSCVPGDVNECFTGRDSFAPHGNTKKGYE